MYTKNVSMNEDLSSLISLIILKSLTFNDAWPSQLPWLKKKKPILQMRCRYFL